MIPVDRLAAAVVIGAVVGACIASPAFAGGSRMDPVRERYEPGEQATLVGYTGSGSLGSFEDQPFYAYLVTGPDPRTGTALGPLRVERTAARGYLSFRASITFRLASDLAPGQYDVSYCNATCDKGLEDLIGGYVYVGVDPPAPISREWALDDPEIAHLAAGAIVSGPGFRLTAAAIRAGRLPPESSQFFAFAEVAPTPANSPLAVVVQPTRDDGAGWVAPVLLASVLAVVAMIGTLLIRRAAHRPAPETP